ncbi:MAG: HipA domain-containing protein, partial [Ruminococcus flavefaciens]|nr:HipA domain-containing protein [Ruminococcus flavefaciens]
VNDVLNVEHLPVGVCHSLKIIDRAVLNHWWRGRSIPASRMGISEALNALGIYETGELLTKCFGLSLSDHYWIKPLKSNLTWEKVNFFDNDFSDDIGDVLFGTSKKVSGVDFVSPDNTSDGNLKKRWKIMNGKRCLIKSGSAPFRQQPFNEVIASKIMDRLGINHVPYGIVWNENEPYSLCENFVTKDTELVSAYRILQIRPKENHENEYLHYVNICWEIGLKDIVSAIDTMIVVDYIIANEDRHLNNFGLLRNADTLEWLGAAPVFDSGTSLWYDTQEKFIPYADIKCKPFKKTHDEQLRLVSDFSVFDFSKLDGIENEIIEILMYENYNHFIDENRAEIIAEAVRHRIDNLQKIVLNHSENLDSSFSEGDLEENISEEYDMKIG